MDLEMKSTYSEPMADSSPPVRKALIEGEKLVAKLDDQLHELEQRLTGVMLPADDSTNPVEKLSKEDRPLESPFLSDLRDHNERLGDMNSMVRYIIARLEV